jgi:primosomal protein N' (replication factor Y)
VGRVIVQTFSPEARPVVLAARHAVAEFMAGELVRRRELGYPPFRHLVRIVVSGPAQEGPEAVLRELRAGLEGVGGDAVLLGPAPLLRLRGRHRAQLLVKAVDPRPASARTGRLLAAATRAMRRDGLAASIDVDPQSV